VRAGRLSDYVTFEKRIPAAGVTPESWTADFGGPISAEAERLSETAAQFIIRYRKTGDGTEINALSHRIIWDGALWYIASAVHDRKRTMLTITCDLTNMIEVTHLESTEREFMEGVPIVEPPEA